LSKKQLSKLSSNRAVSFDFSNEYSDTLEDYEPALLDKDREHLLSSHSLLLTSGDRLLNSERLALETESIGLDILEELHSQREGLERTTRLLDDTNLHLSQSDRLTRSMWRRAIASKILWYLVAFALVTIILLVIVINVT
jgi:vesicle transport through interaction with t-SNAREs protein 1